ncbi:MAG TPA: hypothetical protein VKU19_05075 [Bryobacteraceae bacterium]|nr:hypothetical protein [Bryobacteraceae bacterium]
MEENKHRGVGHEETDVNPWVVGKFAIGLVFVCVISLAILFGFFRFLLSDEGGKAAGVVKEPPKPRLEQTPITDLQAFRMAEDRDLSSYGWVDQQKGIVHVPIDRAIDMLVQKGLPSRQEQAPVSNVSVPMESGLGAKMLPPGGPLAGEKK